MASRMIIGGCSVQIRQINLEPSDFFHAELLLHASFQTVCHLQQVVLNPAARLGKGTTNQTCITG